MMTTMMPMVMMMVMMMRIEERLQQAVIWEWLGRNKAWLMIITFSAQWSSSPNIVAKIQNTKYKIKYEKFKMQGMTYDYHFLCPMIIFPPDIVAKLQKILNSLEDGAQRSPGQWTSSEIT